MPEQGSHSPSAIVLSLIPMNELGKFKAEIFRIGLKPLTADTTYGIGKFVKKDPADMIIMGTFSMNASENFEDNQILLKFIAETHPEIRHIIGYAPNKPSVRYFTEVNHLVRLPSKRIELPTITICETLDQVIETVKQIRATQ